MSPLCGNLAAAGAVPPSLSLVGCPSFPPCLPHPAPSQVVSLPQSLLAGSGPAGAQLNILKTVDLGRSINDVIFCGDWLALALNGAEKARLGRGLKCRSRNCGNCHAPRRSHACLAARALATLCCHQTDPLPNLSPTGPHPLCRLQTDPGTVQLHRRYSADASSLERLAFFPVGQSEICTLVLPCCVPHATKVEMHCQDGLPATAWWGAINTVSCCPQLAASCCTHPHVQGPCPTKSSSPRTASKRTAGVRTCGCHLLPHHCTNSESSASTQSLVAGGQPL